MDKEDLKRRTKLFALRVIRLVEALPRTRTAQVIGNQLLRSATSVAANYRAACRARSQTDFVHKLGIVEEEKVICDLRFPNHNRQSKIGNRKSRGVGYE